MGEEVADRRAEIDCPTLCLGMRDTEDVGGVSQTYVLSTF